MIKEHACLKILTETVTTLPSWHRRLWRQRADDPRPRRRWQRSEEQQEREKSKQRNALWQAAFDVDSGCQCDSVRVANSRRVMSTGVLASFVLEFWQFWACIPGEIACKSGYFRAWQCGLLFWSGKELNRGGERRQNIEIKPVSCSNLIFYANALMSVWIMQMTFLAELLSYQVCNLLTSTALKCKSN